MNKKTKILGVSFALAIGGGLLLLIPSFVNASNFLFRLTANDLIRGVVLNGSNKLALTNEFGDKTGELKTVENNPVNVSLTSAKTLEGGFATLSATGVIENTSMVTGIESVEATFTGNLSVAFSSDRYEFTTPVALTTGVKYELPKTFDYFKFTTDVETQVSSITVQHSCTTRFTGVEHNSKIVGFDSVTNIEKIGESGNRGWGSKYWAAMNFANGQGGRFHFYSPLGGEHEIDWYFQSGGGTYLNVFLNGTQVDDVTVPATGTWYSDSSPTGQKVAVNYNLLQGWNELYYLAPNITHGDGQYAQIGAIEIIGLTNRRYDPSELDTDIHTLHFEAEQGYYVGKNGGSRFYDYTNYSGGELLGAIEADGCGSGVTFQLPSQGAGQYDFTARIGCGGGTTVKVFVDDFETEWSNDCTTTAYQIDNISASANWNVMKTTPSLRVTLPSGWCRIRVEYGGQWFTLDSFDLVKVVE